MNINFKSEVVYLYVVKKGVWRVQFIFFSYNHLSKNTIKTETFKGWS